MRTTFSAESRSNRRGPTPREGGARVRQGTIWLLILVISLVLVAGKQPDLTELYQSSVQNQDRNPVIVIPGLMGSRLQNRDTGQVVWGAFTRKAAKLNTAEGMRQIMLDVWDIPDGFGPDDVPLLEDRLEATGPVAKIKMNALFAILTVRVYSAILGALGAGGYVDQAFAGLDYGPEHFTCFTFFYDWRKDTVVNAQELGRFIEARREQVLAARAERGLPEREVKFDIVAHSLGSLIARYYLRFGAEDVLGGPTDEIPWRGAPDIDRLVLIAPPNLGAVESLRQLESGRDLGPFLPKFPPAALAGIPSIYQLLPRESERPLRDAAGRVIDLAFMDVATWLANDWGPFAARQEAVLDRVWPAGTPREEQRRKLALFVAANLERATRLAAALDTVPVAAPSTRVILFAGDSEATLARGVARKKGNKVELDFSRGGTFDLDAAGDGTVTRASALGDLRRDRTTDPWLVSPVPWSASIFVSDNHLGLTKNRNFQDNLLHILLDRPPSWSR